jgi:hypothetical protein
MRNRKYYQLVRKAAVAEADLTRELLASWRPRVASYRRLLRTWPTTKTTLSLGMSASGYQARGSGD